MTFGYLGCKSRILPFLDAILSPLLTPASTFGDLFSGTGIVAKQMQHRVRRVIASDLELYSYVLNKAQLQCPYSLKLARIIETFNSQRAVYKGLLWKHYSPSSSPPRGFFTSANAMAIDAVRIGINRLYRQRKITYPEFLFLLGSLLLSMGKVSNTAGTYRAFLKDFTFRSLKPFILYPIHYDTQIGSKHHSVIKNDAIKVVRHHAFDVVYLDPPYNACHYGSYYSLLNYICMYTPKARILGTVGILQFYNKSVFGIQKTALQQYKNLIKKLRAKWIVLSYSSDGILTLDTWKSLLISRGHVICYKILHPRYKSNQLNKTKKNTQNNANSTLIEYVFVVQVQTRATSSSTRSTCTGFRGSFREVWVDMHDRDTWISPLYILRKGARNPGSKLGVPCVKAV